MPTYCDRHPTARAEKTDALYGLNFCGHCAREVETTGKLVLVPIEVVTEVVAQ